MLEKLLRMYAAYMVTNNTGLLPHLVGPPGSGKSSVVQDLADLLGVQLHIISVSRLSPLEVEGVQMPHGSGEEMVLRMLPATYWTSLKEGDILLFDEFLRGFPEVYNSLLDAFTSRRVGGFELPNVFMVAASNSVATYDEALEDRLLHIPVPDPRGVDRDWNNLVHRMVDGMGLLPSMHSSLEMRNLMSEVVVPTYAVLDTIKSKKSKAVAAPSFEGKSIRNLIAQVQLRTVETKQLKQLLEANNIAAMSEGKPQYVVLTGQKPPSGYHEQALRLVGNPLLTQVQQQNLELNLQLLDLAEARREKEDG